MKVELWFDRSIVVLKELKNRRLVRSNNYLRNKSMEVILYIPFSITYLLNMHKGYSQNYQ